MTDLFAEHVIAVIWDYDKTLTRSYMQEPLFRRYNVKADTFWAEVRGLAEFYLSQGLTRVSKDTLYLDHILQYVRKGTFAGLTNDTLRELGAEIEFVEGVPEIFQQLCDVAESDAQYSSHNIKVEHYIVSTGLAQMIKGSLVAGHVEDIWACEFVEQIATPGYLEKAASSQLALVETSAIERCAQPIQGIGYHIDNTTKTRALFEINKGVNKDGRISVNDFMPENQRRVPFRQMIYVADGPSDVPVFSVVKKGGGRTFAVYDENREGSYEQAKSLNDQERVDAFGPCNYSPKEPAARWLVTSVREIADQISRSREAQLESLVGKPPQHLS